jgi:alpha-tubulin suppressor-like RCC1 family protein
MADNRGWCWGANGVGQLGNTTNVNASLPGNVLMSDGTEVLDLDQIFSSPHGAQSCAIDANAQLWCWGSNNFGQVGNGTTTNTYYPQLVKTSASTILANVTAVGLGFESTCAIASGTVYCWGNSSFGESGYIGLKSYATIVKDDSGIPFTGVSEISVGQRHSCALKSGSVWCWGLDREGELGNDEARVNSSVPVLVKKSDGTNLTGVDHISNGQFYTCALTTAGEMWCWGSNTLGQLGDGKVIDGRNRAAPVLKSAGVPLKDISEISTGAAHTCARINGEVWCWGYNNNGQLGDGTTTNRLYPVKVILTNGTPLTNATAISNGALYTCAIVNTRMLCWGDNQYGQLGDGTLIDKLRAFINNL